MDNVQIKEITKLQLKGYGYKKIASTLCLSVNSVKSYCRRHPVTAADAKALSVCLSCGKPVEQQPNRKQKKFCSDKCRTAWWNAQPQRGKTESVCLCCGSVIVSHKSKNRKYCSRACYGKAKQRGVIND